MSFTPYSRIATGTKPASSEVRTICIIGAGSSGLVACKHLRDAGYDVEVLEKSSGIGGAFVSKTYDDGALVSSKYLTAFSDLRSPATDPPHLTIEQWNEYLHRYADQEGLWPMIRFGVNVLSVERRGDGYEVRVEGSATRHVDAVCVCSGLHETPYVPDIDGLDGFAGTVLHSSEYKDKSLFAGKRVLIVGCGETGMDLAYRAVQVASQAAMSIRNGFLSVPHEGWGGMPLDTYITNLFEHSYEHWWCHRHHVKWRVTTLVIRFLFFLMTGCTQGYNQWVGGVREIKRGHHILCKSTAAMPYLNRPHKQRTWRSRLWARLFFFSRYVDPACGDVDKSILSYRAPTKVRGRTVTFADGDSFDADIILLATGYRQTFPFLHDKMSAPAAPTAPPTAPPTATAPAAPAAPPPGGARRRQDGARGRQDGARSPAPRASRSPPRSRPAATAAAPAAASTLDAGARAADGCRRLDSSADGCRRLQTAAEGRGSAEADGSSRCDGQWGRHCNSYASWRAGSGARGAEDPLPPEHFIVSPDEPTLAFIGFVRPNVGAIPPMSELQVMWWIQRLRGKVARTSTPPSYGLLGRKLTYGVDYGNYMHQLAAEFGGAPSLSTLALRSPRVLVAYCLGQAYISFFRLEGPFASEKAWAVSSGELFEPVRQRGLLSNAVFVMVTAFFGAINLAAYALELPFLVARSVLRGRAAA